MSSAPRAGLELSIRTPTELVYSGPVLSVRVEDADGWVGIVPGRRDLVLWVQPGILLARDRQGEAFVVNGGGMLDLRGPRCRVALVSASLCRDPDQIESLLSELGPRRRLALDRRSRLDALIEEAVRRATTGHVSPPRLQPTTAEGRRK